MLILIKSMGEAKCAQLPLDTSHEEYYALLQWPRILNEGFPVFVYFELLPLSLSLQSQVVRSVVKSVENRATMSHSMIMIPLCKIKSMGMPLHLTPLHQSLMQLLRQQ